MKDNLETAGSVRTNLQAKYASCYRLLERLVQRRIMRPDKQLDVLRLQRRTIRSEELGQDALWLRDTLQDALRLLAQVCPDGI